MKTILTTLLLSGALYGQSQASEINHSTASKFVSDFYQAIEKHDLATVSNMIDDHAVMTVIWMQTNPPQTFKLSKADYLQQLKATWRFASNEQYAIKNLKVDTVNGKTIATLQETENRVLFGNKAGQSNDLKMSIHGDKNNLRIVAISSKTKLW